MIKIIIIGRKEVGRKAECKKEGSRMAGCRKEGRGKGRRRVLRWPQASHRHTVGSLVGSGKVRWSSPGSCISYS